LISPPAFDIAPPRTHYSLPEQNAEKLLFAQAAQEGSDASGGAIRCATVSSDLFPPHGGYRKLRSFQCAQAVYDATVVFCDRFVEKRSRTRDQMIQAARSGVQNIAEGSVASATSKKTELKLTGVARASLEELLLDYEDFLRQRGMKLWGPDSPQALAVRRKYRSDPSDSGPSDGSDLSDASDAGRSNRSESSDQDRYGIRTASPEVAANTMICLINQASFLLRRQLQALERQFLAEGGFTERLYRERQAQRGKNRPDKSDASDRSGR
jgi:restriction system protein